MKNLNLKAFIVLLICSIVVSCTEKEDESAATESDDSPPVITLKTADFSFLDAPDTLMAGITTFKVENRGMFPHNAELVFLGEDHSYDKYLDYLKSNNGQSPEWATRLGGPSAPISGESSEATLELVPGSYAIVCGVPVPAAEPHFMKGMMHPLTVTGQQESKAPEANITMKMDDYSFGLDSVIEAGTHTIKVENVADQPHEFLLAKLESGKTVNDMLNWLGEVINSESGPLPQAPGIFLNGVSPMSKGGVNYIDVDFSPGEYALICPFPDKEDGMPHFMHGMVQQFSVEAE
ncbi:MAG: hypothetical protein U5J63_01875 [Fodinibius sp.]|nr:hypothetical protein [Fodinibius sp.]